MNRAPQRVASEPRRTRRCNSGGGASGEYPTPDLDGSNIEEEQGEPIRQAGRDTTTNGLSVSGVRPRPTAQETKIFTLAWQSHDMRPEARRASN